MKLRRAEINNFFIKKRVKQNTADSIPENVDCSNNGQFVETMAPYNAGILEVELLLILLPTHPKT